MISKTHFNYIVGILLAIIILQITVKFGADTNLVNYISFALTLTSLILALVSIIYSFYSNSSFSENISTLNSASNKMSEASSKLTEITNALNAKLDDIPTLIKNIESKIDTTHDYLKTSYSTTQKPVSSEDQRVNFATSLVEYFLANNSIHGLFLLYAMTISQSLEKPFNLKDICEQVDLFEEGYSYGFIIACASFGLFNKKEENGYLIISNMYNTILQDIKSKVEIIADTDSKDKQNDFLKEQLRKIEAYYL